MKDKKTKDYEAKRIEARTRIQSLILMMLAAEEYAYSMKDNLQFKEKMAVNRFIKHGRQLYKSLENMAGKKHIEASDSLVEYYVENAEACSDFLQKTISELEDYYLVSGGVAKK